MEYLIVAEVAELWGIPDRCVHVLCQQRKMKALSKGLGLLYSNRCSQAYRWPQTAAQSSFKTISCPYLSYWLLKRAIEKALPIDFRRNHSAARYISSGVHI